MKRIFAFFLALVLLLTVLPQTAMNAVAAETSGTCGDVTWSFSDGVLTFSGTGAMADYTSSSFRTAPWSGIATQITKVVFESGVTRIGSYAFYNYNNQFYANLSEVVIKGAKTVGKYAFKYCSALQTVSFGSGLQVIESNAFSYCSAVSGLDFPAGLEEIGNEAFNFCETVQSVVLPEGMKTIGYSAFGNCASLTDATIPASVTSIGVHIFNNCTGETVHGDTNSIAYMYCMLGGIKFAELGTVSEIPVYASGAEENISWTFYADGTLVISGTGAMPDYTTASYTNAPWFAYSRQVTKVVVEEGITYIGNYTFLNTSNTYYPKLTAVEINGDPTLGEGVFKYDNLTSVTFNGAPEKIGKDAFAYCDMLTEITLSEGLTEIGYAAFRGCTSLTSVELPASVTTIGDYAFSGCDMLSEVYFQGDAPLIGIWAFNGVTANAYYHMTASGWTAETKVNYSGKLTWVSYECTHTYNAVVTEPTCLDAGFTTYTCTRCGDSYTGDETAPLGHDYQGVTTEPTCLDGGYTVFTCARCGDSYTGNETDALGHSWGEAIVTKEPTEDQDGSALYICSRCKETKTEIIPALGHEHHYTETVTAPTCTEQGYTTHTCACGDSYTDTYTPALGHDYTDAVTAPTCLEAGYTTHTCTRCGDSYTDSETDALGHSWDEGTVTKEPTEEEDGVRTFTCTRCGETKTELIPALDHEHTYEETVVAATCTEQGYTVHTCKCGESYTDTYTPALGHDYAVTETKEPTCSKAGYTVYTCARCGDVRTKEIPVFACPAKDYTDVPNTSNWGHAGIDFCISRGIMGSTDPDALTFEPGTVCTRAMIATILYSYTGAPEDVQYEAAFPDVPDGKWYSKAVIWAYQNKVMKGYDTGKFGPNDIITREQMAVILKAYTEQIAHKDTSATASLSSFVDASKVTWSKPYVSWAVAVGMISGKLQSDGKTMLDPQGKATRAEVASILMSFIRSLED